MKRYLLVLVVLLNVDSYRYRHRKSHLSHKNKKQPLGFGPMKNRVIGFDPDSKDEIDYKVYKS